MFSEETPTERQLDDINRRYDDLLSNLEARVDDLNLSRQHIERDQKVGEQLDWVKVTEAKLTKAEPRIPATDIKPLEAQITALEVNQISTCMCDVISHCWFLAFWIDPKGL